jgi:hypothetical protein
MMLKDALNRTTEMASKSGKKKKKKYEQSSYNQVVARLFNVCQASS